MPSSRRFFDITKYVVQINTFRTASKSPFRCAPLVEAAAITTTSTPAKAQMEYKDAKAYKATKETKVRKALSVPSVSKAAKE